MTEPTEIRPPKVKITRNSSGNYHGWIYANGKELEKTGGKTGFWTKENAIDFTNKRVNYWRAKLKTHIPYYEQEQPNA